MLESSTRPAEYQGSGFFCISYATPPVLVKVSGGQWLGGDYAELSSQEGFRGQSGHDGAELGECKKVERVGW
jgi:hypothetical protein